MARRTHTRTAAAVGALLIGLPAASAAASSPPDSTPADDPIVVQTIVVQTIPGPATPVAPAQPAAPVVARPTPFVVAQHLVELEGTRSMQWQATPSSIGPDGTPLDATANLFAFADDTLLFLPSTSPLGPITAAADEVIAIPVGTRWDLQAPNGETALTTFGLGHEAGGTAPVGQPFAVEADGWYELQVRAHQLLPGEFAEVGNDGPGTLLIGRGGVVTVDAAQLAAGDALSTGRTTARNDGADIATFLEATVTPAPAGGPTESQPPATAPPQTAAPGGTAAPTAAPTAPSTTEGPRAPTANNDSASLHDGRALIEANGSATITINVMSNDDRGNPQAVVVSVDGSESNVGQTVGGGPASTRINADGTATFSTSFHNPVYSVSHSVQYEIENEHGRSMAIASFEIFFCPESGGSAC